MHIFMYKGCHSPNGELYEETRPGQIKLFSPLKVELNSIISETENPKGYRDVVGLYLSKCDLYKIKLKCDYKNNIVLTEEDMKVFEAELLYSYNDNE